MTRNRALRRGQVAAISAMLLAALTACGDSAGPTGTDAQGRSVLKVAQTTPAEWVQPVLAQETGEYERADLTVEMTEFSSGRDALQALSGGAADIAMATPSNVAGAVLGGQDLVVFGVVARWQDWRLIARPGSGITEPKDLVGRKIGVPTGTSADQSLGVLLKTHDISRDEVEIVNVAPPDMNPALTSSSVDAVNIWQPNLSVLEDQIPGTTALPYTMPSSFLFVTTRPFVESNREVLLRFLDANEATDPMLEGDRNRALDLMTGPSRIDRAILETVWQDFEFRTTGPDAGTLSELESSAQFVIDSGAQPGPAPDFGDHVAEVRQQ